MRIVRHKVDSNRFAAVLSGYAASLPNELSRLKRSVNELYSFFRGRLNVAILSTATPTPANVGIEALVDAARAGGAMFFYARIENLGRPFHLRDDLMPAFTSSPDESLLDVSNWTRAFNGAVVARQPKALGALAAISYQFLLQSSTRGA